MDVSNNLNSLYTGLIKNPDKKIDSAGLQALKKEILADGKITKAEHDFIVDVIDNGEFKKGVAKEAISFLEENPVKEVVKPEVKVSDPKPVSPSETTETQADKPSTEEPKAEEVKLDQEGNPVDWKKDSTLTGGFNFTSGNNGGETRGNLKYEGAFQKSRNKIDYSIFADYGKSTNIDSATGSKQTNISGNELSFNTTYSYLMKKEEAAFNYAPYIKFETKGKITDLKERSYRESSGIEIMYANEKAQSNFDLKIGFATEQKFDITNSNLDREAGGELVFTGKQGLGFLDEKNKWLNRTELSGTLNATRLTSLDGNTGTNFSAYLGTRVYITEDKNTFMEVGKKFESTAGTNGSPNSINNTTMVNFGFKY